MQILETNIKFNGTLKKRQYTRHIVVHHSASDEGSAALFHQWHLARDFAGLGYHYVINKDGRIERGRPDDTIGAHCTGPRNLDAIAICLVGNFTNYKPTTEQFKALVWLIKDIRRRYGNLPVSRHSDHGATACPGRMFPFQDVLKGLEVEPVADWKNQIMNDARGLGLITSAHNPDEPAAKWFVLAIAINVLKAIKGGN